MPAETGLDWPAPTPLRQSAQAVGKAIAKCTRDIVRRGFFHAGSYAQRLCLHLLSRVQGKDRCFGAVFILAQKLLIETEGRLFGITDFVRRIMMFQRGVRRFHILNLRCRQKFHFGA